MTQAATENRSAAEAAPRHAPSQQAGSPNFETIDFFMDPSLVDDPFPYYEYLRSKGPVVRLPHHDSVAVVGFDESISVFRDTQTFSSCNASTGPIPAIPFKSEGDDVSHQIETFGPEIPYFGQLVNLDPPLHSPSRSLLMQLFTPSRLKANLEFMLMASDRQIDEFAESGRCELISQYGGPFSTLVIADLLGVPGEDRQELRTMLSEEVREKLGAVPGQIGVDSKPPIAFDFLRDKFTDYVEDRRANPRDDVLSELARARFPDGSFPDAMEIVRLTTFLFAAGQGTTALFLGSALRILGEWPDLQVKLRRDPSLIPDFIEEALRLEGPTKSEGRLARVSTSLGGVDIPAGTTVVLLLPAANRDPRRFESPNEFRLGRPRNTEHLAFGRGAHTCAGSPLARAETRVSLERLLGRFQDIRISEEHHGPPGARRFEYNPTYILRGLKRLHLELTPSG